MTIIASRPFMMSLGLARYFLTDERTGFVY
jgi:hypothetical protein